MCPSLDILRSDSQKVSSSDDISGDVKAYLKAIDKVDTSIISMQSKLDDIGRLSEQIHNNVFSVRGSTSTAATTHFSATGGDGAVDRSRNVAMFGVAENLDADTWRCHTTRSGISCRST